MVRPIAPQLRQQGWQICVGASGTVQALQEIMVAQGMDERITLPKLRQLKQRAIQCGKLEELEIEGLTLSARWSSRAACPFCWPSSGSWASRA